MITFTKTRSAAGYISRHTQQWPCPLPRAGPAETAQGLRGRADRHRRRP